MNSFRPRHRLLLVALLLLAFALRLHRLGSDSLWYDESVSALLAAKSLPAMWAHTARDIHPPLYYALLHLWTAVAGRGEFALAFLSLWFSMAALPLATQIGRRLYGPHAGLLAAFLTAINPLAIWYAQEVRMYTLGSFLLLLILWLGLDLIRRPRPRPWLWGGYALLAALALWTLYYSAFALLALNLFLIPWLWRRVRPRLWPWLLAQGAALLLYLPWLPIALRQALDPPVPPWRAPLPWSQLLLQAGQESSVALLFGQTLDPTRWWPLAGLALLTALAIWRTGPRLATALLWVSILGPLALILAVSLLFTPLYHVRYLSLYAATFPILLAAGLLQLATFGRRRWLLTLCLLPLLAGSALSLRNYHGDRFAYEAADDLRGAVRLIYDQIGPGEALLINAGYLYPAFLAYWPDEVGWLGRLSALAQAAPADSGLLVALAGHVDGDPGIGWDDPASDFYAISQEETAARLSELFAGHHTLWLLRGYDTVNDPQGFIRDWLAAHGQLLHDQVFPGQTFVRVQAWRTTQTPRDALPASVAPLAQDFSGGIRLLGYARAPAAPPLRLTLYWQRRGPIDRDWKILVQLLSPQQQVIAQDDAPPLRGLRPTSAWQPDEVVESTFVLHPPTALPPGAYTVITGFYDETSGARLPLAAGGDALVLEVWNPNPDSSPRSAAARSTSATAPPARSP